MSPVYDVPVYYGPEKRNGNLIRVAAATKGQAKSDALTTARLDPDIDGDELLEAGEPIDVLPERPEPSGADEVLEGD